MLHDACLTEEQITVQCTFVFFCAFYFLFYPFVIFLFVISILLYCWGLLTVYKISQVILTWAHGSPNECILLENKRKNGFWQELPHCCVRFLYYLDVVVKYRGPNSNDKDNSVVQLTWWDLNWVCWWPSSRSHPCAGRAEALS